MNDLLEDEYMIVKKDDYCEKEAWLEHIGRLVFMGFLVGFLLAYIIYK